MDAFRTRVLGTLVQENDVVFDTVVALHRGLCALHTNLAHIDATAVFVSDLCRYLDTCLPLTVGTPSHGLLWLDYVDGGLAMPPDHFVVPHPETLLDPSLKLDFLYDPRREHISLSRLISASDALYTRAEVLRELAVWGGGGLGEQDEYRDLRANESACMAIEHMARAMVAAASTYEAFLNRICAEGLSIAERDDLLAKVGFGAVLLFGWDALYTVFIHTSIHTHTHTHKYKHTHTHTHTDTQTHTNTNTSPPPQNGDKKGPVSLCGCMGWFRTRMPSLRSIMPSSLSELPYTTSMNGIQYTVSALDGPDVLSACRIQEAHAALSRVLFGSDYVVAPFVILVARDLPVFDVSACTHIYIYPHIHQEGNIWCRCSTCVSVWW